MCPFAFCFAIERESVISTFFTPNPIFHLIIITRLHIRRGERERCFLTNYHTLVIVTYISVVLLFDFVKVVHEQPPFCNVVAGILITQVLQIIGTTCKFSMQVKDIVMYNGFFLTINESVNIKVCFLSDVG